MHHSYNGVYLFIVDGGIIIDNTELSKRDGIGITESNSFEIKAISNSKILFIEVPMQF